MSNERTVPVEIVRPKQNWWVGFVIGIGGLLLRSWVAMLCLGSLLPHLGISYHQAVLGMVIISLTHSTDWLTWTRVARSK